MDNSVVSVVVTFNPDPGLLERMFTVLHKECPIIIVDNGSGDPVLHKLRDLVRVFPSVNLVELGENLGIAAAQNRGIERVQECYPGFRFILTLDHDSVPEPGMCQALVARADTCIARAEKLGAIGPLLIETRTGQALSIHRIVGIFWWKAVVKPGQGLARVHSLNSSGSLITRDALEKVGGFDASMFIDHVETEWCFRAMDHGYTLYVDQDTSMEHALGDDVVMIGKSGNRSMPARSPKRHYTIIRNAIYLQKKPYVPRVWKFWNLVKILFTLTYFGLFASDSRDQRSWMWRGIRDGRRGAMGGYPAS